MQALLTLLFRVAYAPLLRVVTASVRPIFDNLTLEPEHKATIFSKIAADLQGQTVTYAPLGVYTALQEQDIIEGVSDIVTALLTEFQITNHADIGRLLGDVATNLAPAPTPAA